MDGSFIFLFVFLFFFRNKHGIIAYKEKLYFYVKLEAAKMSLDLGVLNSNSLILKKYMQKSRNNLSGLISF